METIAIISEKGGIAKTTTCFSLGGEMARQGKRVLLLDLDPQGSLTDCFRLGTYAETVASLFGEQMMVGADRLVMPTQFANLSIVPGDRGLKPINCWQSFMPQYGAGQFAIRDFIADLGGRFDRVLIDGPPGLEFCAWAATTAADYVLTPTFADTDGARTIQFTNDEIRRVQASVNPNLVQLGIVLGDHYPKSANHIAHAVLLKNGFPGLLFEAFFPHAAVFKEARNNRTPVGFFRPRSAAAKAVGAVCAEIEGRIAGAWVIEEKEAA